MQTEERESTGIDQHGDEHDVLIVEEFIEHNTSRTAAGELDRVAPKHREIYLLSTGEDLIERRDGAWATTDGRLVLQPKKKAAE